jgi:hypothetical protein
MRARHGVSVLHLTSIDATPIGEQEFVAQRLADILSAIERDYPAALAQYLDTRLVA